MENGYSILWTDNALEELAETIHYLALHFTEKETRVLANEIERITFLIANNPALFPQSGIKKA